MSAANAAVCDGVFIHPQALVESSDIGPRTRIWAFAHVMQGVHIGSGCNVCEHVFIETGAFVGNGVTIKNGVSIWDGVTVEDDVFLGPNCVLTNDLNPRARWKKSHAQLLETRIGAGATVGANATIVCGVTIDRSAFIGAGAVVVKSVPAFALVVGNPARQTGWMCICGDKLGLQTAVPQGTSVACNRCGTVFILAERGLEISANPVCGAEVMR